MLLFPLLLASNAVAQDDSPPNIIFIMADDLGFNDVSWNNPDVITPNLQSMVDNGVTLDQSYSQAACTPSRAAYLSGYYPFHIGVQNSVVREGMEDYIPLDVTFLPSRLKEAGYSTHLVGKWHLGSCRRDVTPPAKGFDTFLGLLNGYNDYYTKKILPIASHEDFDPDAPGTIYDFFANYTIEPSPEDNYTTDIFTERAQELIREFQDTPFFIALHYTAPHWPLQDPPNFDDSLYANVTDSNRKMYLSMVTAMDEGIGKVVETLDEEGVLDNTIIVFQSDNGGDTHFSASNDPLRERKTTLFEGGTRVPSMVYAPGILQNTPRVSNSLFHIVDWFTTFLAAAGLDPGNVDAVNQWDMLRYGESGPRSTFIYNIYRDNAAIRFDKYKLIEGDPYAFQARRKRDANDGIPAPDSYPFPNMELFMSSFPAGGSRRKRASDSRGSDTTDTYKMMKAFHDLSCSGKIDPKKLKGKWTMEKMIELLESYKPENIIVDIDCHSCKLYDLTTDPSETMDLANSLPAVVLYMNELLDLYKAEEVESVLAYPYKQDPRSKISDETLQVSNTWCECCGKTTWHTVLITTKTKE